ncbi:SPOR domain-containing protein [Rhodovibrio sodomensis]|nr:SPOR domain-containing protein [Rhodovibrio sodomensis]
MPAQDSTDPRSRGGSQPGSGRGPGSPRQGYGLLAAAWLLLLAGAALVGWYVQTAGPGVRPVRTAVLHTGDLPHPPAPAATAGRSGEIDPRVRQLAARLLATGPAQPSAPADAARAPSASDPPAAPAAPVTQAANGGETGSVDTAPDEATADVPPVQLAARTDGPGSQAAAANPMPPPVPRSVVSPTLNGAGQGDAARYSVQVGAFRLRENAVERAARLSQAGYDVRIVHAFATRSRLYMIRLGQFDARPAAMAYARQLARDVGVETWPVRN